MTKAVQGKGTVRAVKSRATGAVIGYRALLPREHSKAPRGIKNPEFYQEPLGERCDTAEEARSLLNAVLVEMVDRTTLKNGLPFSQYVQSSIQSLHQEARRQYKNDARANRRISTAKSIDKHWLPKAEWYSWAPHLIQQDDIQRFVNMLRDEGEGKSGEPLSGTYIRSIAGVVRAAFVQANIRPNPAIDLDLPPKTKPRPSFLELRSQLALFGCEEKRIALADRVMIGCGMGSGLRVGEMLAFEANCVRVDDRDPHLIVRYGGQHRAPPKGRGIRRVELFEPGLGFWRIWMKQFYRGGPLVFAGPLDGYQKSWPENFPGWAEVAAVDHMSSHIMRHTYAVAALSGTWGYEPRSMEFVSQQLGHADLTTTQRYYGAFEAGVWKREVQHMTGRTQVARTPITAVQLLGLDASNDASGGNSSDDSGGWGPSPSLTPSSGNKRENCEVDALTHQSFKSLPERLENALACAGRGARLSDAQTLELHRDSALRIAELESENATLKAALSIALRGQTA